MAKAAGQGPLCLLALTVVCLSVMGDAQAAQAQRCKVQAFRWYYSYGDAEDCTKFYICNFGFAHPKSCPDGTVFSDEHEVCVHIGSEWDKCTVKGPDPKDFVERCRNGETGLLPHPSICQRYFNCSDTEKPSMYSGYLDYEKECTYPNVFDSTKMACVYHLEATCEPPRVASKWICNYRNEQCWKSHCIPCESRHGPSCDGRPDGKYQPASYGPSPIFFFCKGGRTVGGRQYCPNDNIDGLGITQFFSSQQGQCVSILRVPKEQGGIEPSCTGLQRGFYRSRDLGLIVTHCPGKELFICQGLYFYSKNPTRGKRSVGEQIIELDMSKCQQLPL